MPKSMLVLVRVTGEAPDAVALGAVRIALAHGYKAVHEHGSRVEVNTVGDHDFEVLVAFDDQPSAFHVGRALTTALAERPDVFDEAVSEPVYRPTADDLRGSVEARSTPFDSGQRNGYLIRGLGATRDYSDHDGNGPNYGDPADF